MSAVTLSDVELGVAFILNVMLSVTMLSVVMLSVVILSVVKVSVLEPLKETRRNEKFIYRLSSKCSKTPMLLNFLQ